jgi:hypothetical protein
MAAATATAQSIDLTLDEYRVLVEAQPGLEVLPILRAGVIPATAPERRRSAEESLRDRALLTGGDDAVVRIDPVLATGMLTLFGPPLLLQVKSWDPDTTSSTAAALLDGSAVTLTVTVPRDRTAVETDPTTAVTGSVRFTFGDLGSAITAISELTSGAPAEPDHVPLERLELGLVEMQAISDAVRTADAETLSAVERQLGLPGARRFVAPLAVPLEAGLKLRLLARPGRLAYAATWVQGADRVWVRTGLGGVRRDDGTLDRDSVVDGGRLSLARQPISTLEVDLLAVLTRLAVTS